MTARKGGRAWRVLRARVLREELPVVVEGWGGARSDEAPAVRKDVEKVVRDALDKIARKL